MVLLFSTVAVAACASASVVPAAATTTPSPSGVSWSQPMPARRDAGRYVLTVNVATPRVAQGVLVQLVHGVAPQLRVASFHASPTGTVVSASVYVADPQDRFQVATTAPATVGALTLTPAPASYVVRGTTFLDASGQPIVWHGLNLSPYATASDIPATVAQTRANLVRVPVSECMWMTWSANYVPTYRQAIIDKVHAVTASGATAIVDLHWACHDSATYRQDGYNTFDQVAPDQHSVAFWQDAANVFKSDQAVMFELFNEPQVQDWAVYSGHKGGDVWRNGGTVSYWAQVWQAPGMQSLYEAVRSTGATNVVLADGTDWGSSLVPVMSNPLDGTNVAYAYHAYVHSGQSHSAHSPYLDSWVAPVIDPRGSYAQAAIATEFGTDQRDPAASSYFRDTISWIENHGNGWAVWGWYSVNNDRYGLLARLPATPASGAGGLVLSSF